MKKTIQKTWQDVYTSCILSSYRRLLCLEMTKNIHYLFLDYIIAVKEKIAILE
jgi:hypothetical protein